MIIIGSNITTKMRVEDEEKKQNRTTYFFFSFSSMMNDCPELLSFALVFSSSPISNVIDEAETDNDAQLSTLRTNKNKTVEEITTRRSRMCWEDRERERAKKREKEETKRQREEKTKWKKREDAWPCAINTAPQPSNYSFSSLFFSSFLRTLFFFFFLSFIRCRRREEQFSPSSCFFIVVARSYVCLERKSKGESNARTLDGDVFFCDSCDELFRSLHRCSLSNRPWRKIPRQSSLTDRYS